MSLNIGKGGIHQGPAAKVRDRSGSSVTDLHQVSLVWKMIFTSSLSSVRAENQNAGSPGNFKNNLCAGGSGLHSLLRRLVSCEQRATPSRVAASGKLCYKKTKRLDLDASGA